MTDSAKQAVVDGARVWAQAHTSLARDLNAALSIPIDKVEAVVKTLGDLTEPIAPAATRRRVSDMLEDQPRNSRDALVRLTLFIPDLHKHDPQFIPGLIERWEQSPPSHMKQLTSQEKTQLLRLVKLLSTPIKSIEAGKNVERVGRMTGMDLESVEIVCDLRPVFSQEDAAAIEALIPIATIRIVCEQDTGVPQSLEARLTAQQLEDLEKKLTRAKAKMQTMATFVAEHNIPYAIAGEDN